MNNPTSWKRALFLFLVLKALVFIFVLPPWQIPDEPSHAEYAIHWNGPFPGLHAEIVASLKEFETWRYAESEENNPTGNFISIVGVYPPLYYWIVSRWLPPSSLVGKAYWLRLTALLFQAAFFAGCVWLVRSFILRSSDGWPNPESLVPGFALIVAAGAVLIPQSSLFFAGVMPDLLACVVVTLTVALVTDLFGLFDGTGADLWSLQGAWRYALLALLLAAASVTKANALLVFPVTALALLLLPLRFRSLRDVRNYLTLGLAGAILLFITVPVAAEFYDLVALAERAAPFVRGSLRPFSELSQVSIGVLGRAGAILFVSFWYSFGWMVYKMGLSWYAVFAALSMAAAVGWLVVRFSSRAQWMCMLVYACALAVSVWIILIQFDPESLQTLPQGRYVFPNLGIIALLIVAGWGRLWYSNLAGRVLPKSVAVWRHQAAVRGLLIFLVFLNVLVVFKYVIPTFYLR